MENSFFKSVRSLWSNMSKDDYWKYKDLRFITLIKTKIINIIYLLLSIFAFVYLLYLIYIYYNTPETEIINEWQDSYDTTTYYRGKRTPALILFIIKTFGKNGLLLFFLLLDYFVFISGLLPNIRKVLGKNK